jgi:hypothetical protein
MLESTFKTSPLSSLANDASLAASANDTGKLGVIASNTACVPLLLVPVTLLGSSLCGGKIGVSEVCLASACTIGAHKAKSVVISEAVKAKADYIYLIQASSGDMKAYGDGCVA